MITLCFVAVTAPADDFDLDWWTVDGGGAMWTTEPIAQYELSGTVGQPDASATVMTGGDFELSGGFWPMGLGPAGSGDCDDDGDADLDDFAVIASCLAGPQIGLSPECACADLDGDGDGDLADFAVFQRGFTGPP